MLEPKQWRQVVVSCIWIFQIYVIPMVSAVPLQDARAKLSQLVSCIVFQRDQRLRNASPNLRVIAFCQRIESEIRRIARPDQGQLRCFADFKAAVAELLDPSLYLL